MLSKFWNGLIPSTAVTTNTDTLRALLGLDGSFRWRDRDYFWELAASRGYTRNENSSYNTVNYRFNNGAQDMNVGLIMDKFRRYPNSPMYVMGALAAEAASMSR